jgi:hypothetical protein
VLAVTAPGKPSITLLFFAMPTTLVFAGEGFFSPDDGKIHSFTLRGDQLLPGPVHKQGGTFPMWLVSDAACKFLCVFCLANCTIARYTDNDL